MNLPSLRVDIQTPPSSSLPSPHTPKGVLTKRAFPSGNPLNLKVDVLPGPDIGTLQLFSSSPSSESSSPSSFSQKAPLLAKSALAQERVSSINPGKLSLMISTSPSQHEFGLKIQQEQPAETPITIETVEAETNRLVTEESGRYVSKFDYSNSAVSVLDLLKSKYPGQRIELVKTAEGVTDTKIVKVNGVSRHILKRVSLPEKLLKGHWKNVKTSLNHAGGNSLRERVRKVFLEKPGQVLVQEYSHANNAQREKLAYAVGSNLGVPKTETMRTREGVYSLHDFSKNEGSARTYDIALPENQAILNLQDLQDIGILDILIENQDRNPGNILVVEKDTTPLWACCLPCFSSTRLDLVPIDHALSFQKESFQPYIGVEVKPPCWTKWSKADEPLTDETKRKIASLKASDLIQQAKNQGIRVDDKIKTSLSRNVEFLKAQIRQNPDITLNQLYKDFSSLR